MAMEKREEGDVRESNVAGRGGTLDYMPADSKDVGERG